MILINGLKKQYKTTKGKTFILGEINLELPDRGLVFILGRSGSGKSTLLNIIGTLDTQDSGTIDVNGFELKGGNPEEYASFRNEEVGFIFQDFCLMENFSVYENVISSSLIKEGSANEERIDSILESLGLLEYKDRNVQKLSAGQRQRVSIARAVAKDPKIILCDEPTGNLDYRTTHKILSFLHKLSQDKLVIIVSHNVDDAYRYAERIIELSDGKVISDKANPYSDAPYVIQDDTLYLSNYSSLDEQSVDDINEAVPEIKRIRQKKDLFVDYKRSNKKNDKRSYGTSKANAKTLFHYIGGFFIHSKASSISAMVLSGLLLFSNGLIRNARSFTASDFFSAIPSGNDAMVFTKHVVNEDGSINRSLFSDVREEKSMLDDQNIKYDLLYAYTPWAYPSMANDNWALYGWNRNSSYSSLLRNAIGSADKKSYKPTTCTFSGTYIISEGRYRERFDLDENEDIYVLKGEEKNHGLYVTDVIADLIVEASSSIRSYEQVLGYQTITGTNKVISKPVYINGILRTNFYERYGQEMSEVLRHHLSSDSSLADLSADLNLWNIILKRYYDCNAFYSFNPNFIEDKIEEGHIITNSNSFYFSYGGQLAFSCHQGDAVTPESHVDDNLGDYEICFSSKNCSVLGALTRS